MSSNNDSYGKKINIFYFENAGVGLGLVFITIVGALLVGAALILFATALPSKTLDIIIHDHEFWSSVWTTFAFAVLAVSLKAILVWPLALLLGPYRKGRVIWLTLLPWLLPIGVASLTWLWFFYDLGGGANEIFSWFGLRAINWLGDKNWSRLICISFNVWRELPLWAVVLAPGLKGFSGSIASLATLDSLSTFERIRFLVLPRVFPVLIALVMLSLIWTMGEFEAIWILTRGGPGIATQTMPIYAFRHAYLSQTLARGIGAYIVFFPFIALILTVLILIYRQLAIKART